MKTPRKYQLWTNSYGNLDAHPPGVKWVTFDTVGVTRRKASHRFALDSGRIFTYKVLDGFTGSNRRGWSPILIPIIHMDQMPLFRRLVTQYQRQAEKQKARRKREYARLCKTPEYQAKLAARRELRRARDTARREAEAIANLPCRSCHDADCDDTSDATMIDDNGTCRILLWPETNVSAATYCVYDLGRDCSHATKSLGHAEKLFRRWSARSVPD